jgi:ribonuclease P/MRP protein subunit RPP40
VDLILPAEIYDLIHTHIEDSASVYHSQYARVYLSLSDILASDFLNEYIKKGNIMILSEGKPLLDNRMSLYEGVLRLELDRPTYERCGLQGRPIEDGGKKHQKARWVVEFDLRNPSMQHGKKGFGRLEWAAKEVLNQSLSCLFYNFNPTSRESLPAGAEPISIHQPSIQSITPTTTKASNVLCPHFTVGDLPGIYEQEDAMALLEYIHILELESPRISRSDNIDSFLSRYEVPDFGSGTISKDFVRLRWSGFIPPQFIRDLFLAVRKDGLKGEKKSEEGEAGTQEMNKEGRWIALSAQGFNKGESWTVMQFAGRETLTWDVL